MALSIVDIANLALEKLGQTVTITALSENTKHAKAMNRAWDRVRQYVLTDHPWQFATVFWQAALLADPPLPGWQFRYGYPGDCLNLIAVTDAQGIRGNTRTITQEPGRTVRVAGGDGRRDFEVANSATQTSVCTDVDQAYFIYVADVADTGRWPAKFVEAFACRLAWDRAGAIAGEVGLQMRNSLMQDYLYAKIDAGAQDYNESRDMDVDFITPSVMARR